jgi:branched-chain amino acid transport system permease protein
MLTQIAINGLIAGCIYSAVALGFTLIYGTVRFFHFAHGAIYACGAYLAWLTIVELEFPIIAGATVACFLVGVLGLLTDVAVYRPLRARKSPNLVLLLASFGIFIVLTSLLQLAFGPDIRVVQTGVVLEGRPVLGARITDIQIAIVFVCFSLALLLALFVKRTRLGTAIRAVADDPIAACLVGIDSKMTISATFFMGSILAGAAGILVSLETGIEPTMGMSAVIKGIIAAVVGGIGSIPGALIGGLLIGTAENLGTWGISSGWKDAIAFIVLVVFLLIRPGGIFESKRESRRF